MNITELLPKLSPSAQAEIGKVLNAPWEPKEGDDLWFVGFDGAVNHSQRYTDFTLKPLHARNRIFRTREEAEQDKLTGMDAKLVAQTTINRFCEAEGVENKFVAEGDSWYPYIDRTTTGKIGAILADYCQVSTIFNVRTESDAEKIITACGNEIKILLGVQ
jgi:hypothetical protein